MRFRMSHILFVYYSISLVQREPSNLTIEVIISGTVCHAQVKQSFNRRFYIKENFHH